MESSGRAGSISFYACDRPEGLPRDRILEVSTFTFQDQAERRYEPEQCRAREGYYAPV